MNKIFKIILVLFLGLTLLLLHTTPNINAIDEPFASWVSEENLPYTTASHQAEAYNNQIYVFGGAGIRDVFHSDILSADINQNGSLSKWKTISSLPEAIIWHNTVRNDNNIYLLGGAKKDPTVHKMSTLDTVYLYSINQDGTLAQRKDLAKLTKNLAMGGVVIYNDKIYYMGGFIRNQSPSTPNFESSIYSAEIYSDGTIGSWQTLSTSLPEANAGFATFLIGNRIVLVGGKDSTDTEAARNIVISTTINSNDGTLSDWETLPSIPQPLQRSAFTIFNNHFLLIGGYHESSYVKTILYSPIENDGKPGPWQTNSIDFPTINCCVPAVEINGHIYVTGGHNGSTYLSSVYRTTTPPPTPQPPLNIPDLKQNDSRWKDEEYDKASEWAPDVGTIERWGCGLTSAAMVLQYHGFPINPDGLNDWLNDEPDGYIRNGLLNWLAVSRYTYKNTTEDSPTLEFRRYDASSTKLEEELNAERPPILGLSGHFVVAKGEQGLDFLINDPDSTIDSLSEVETAREAEYSSIYSYLPSNTDLSYIMLVVDPNITLTVYNSEDNEVGNFYPDEFLEDDISGEEGEYLNILLLPEPPDGVYRVKATGTGDYQLDSYLYNKDGKVKVSQIEGEFEDGEDSNTFYINFSQKRPGIYFDFFWEILQELESYYYEEEAITKKGIYYLLRSELTLANNLLIKGNVKTSKKILQIMIHHIKIFARIGFIDKQASDNLQESLDSIF